MRWQLATIAAVPFGIAAASPDIVGEFSGTVVALSDGDTITVLKARQQVKVRLEGIDASEKTRSPRQQGLTPTPNVSERFQRALFEMA